GHDTIYTSLAYYAIGDGDIEDVAATGTSGSYLIGNGLANLMVGNTGADTLDGGAGADFLGGGPGADHYFWGNAADVIAESAGQGRDTVYASVSYTLGDVDIEDLALLGSGNLNASGNSLANLIVGNGGDNLIRGMGGADQLVGGGGADQFVYGSAS